MQTAKYIMQTATTQLGVYSVPATWDLGRRFTRLERIAAVLAARNRCPVHFFSADWDSED